MYSIFRQFSVMSSRTGPEDYKKPFEERFFDSAANGNTEEINHLLKGTHINLLAIATKYYT